MSSTFQPHTNWPGLCLSSHQKRRRHSMLTDAKIWRPEVAQTIDAAREKFGERERESTRRAGLHEAQAMPALPNTVNVAMFLNHDQIHNDGHVQRTQLCKPITKIRHEEVGEWLADRKGWRRMGCWAPALCCKPQNRHVRCLKKPWCTDSCQMKLTHEARTKRPSTSVRRKHKVKAKLDVSSLWTSHATARVAVLGRGLRGGGSSCVFEDSCPCGGAHGGEPLLKVVKGGHRTEWS